MDKQSKFEYQQNIESYLEDKQVFELLEGLLRKLIVSKPDDPYSFLIQKLQKTERKCFGLIVEWCLCNDRFYSKEDLY